MKKLLIILVILGVIFIPTGNVYAKTSTPVVAQVKATTTKTSQYVGEGFCRREGPKKVFRMGGYILLLMQIIAPFIVAVIGAVDIFKAVTDGKAETLAKQGKLVLKRFVVVLIIAFIPTIIYQFIKAVNPKSVEGADNCYACLMEPSKCDITDGT